MIISCSLSGVESRAGEALSAQHHRIIVIIHSKARSDGLFTIDSRPGVQQTCQLPRAPVHTTRQAVYYDGIL